MDLPRLKRRRWGPQWGGGAGFGGDRDVTRRGDAVLDTFLGSGSTMLAAEDTGRLCLGVELEPLYVDLSVRRWRHKTGRDAVHVDTGEAFETRQRRLAADPNGQPHG